MAYDQYSTVIQSHIAKKFMIFIQFVKIVKAKFFSKLRIFHPIFKFEAL